MTGRLALRISSAACVEAGFFHPQHGVRPIGARLGGFKVEDGSALLRVLGNVDEHRAGPAGARNLKCLANGVGQVLGLADQEVVLGHRQRNAGDIDFLKGVGAQHLAGYIAGDADDGNGIEHGRGNAGDKIGCAGAAGGNGHAHFARSARIAVGHVRGALLVAHQHVADGNLRSAS